MLQNYKKVPHILEVQDQLERQMLQDFEKGTYTIENPFVRVNPYEVAPLTALIMFRTSEPVSVKMMVPGDTDNTAFQAEFPKTNMHIIPVYCLHPGEENPVSLKCSDGTETTVVITTDALPEKVKKPTKFFCRKDTMEGQLMFESPTSPANLAGYDSAGECRWYCTLNLVFAFKKMKNGHFMVGTERLVMGPYNTTGLYEMDLLGKIYAEYRIPGGYHHDEMELENGDLLILTQDPYRGTVEDQCVLVDRLTGEIKKVWDYTKVLPQGTGTFSKSPDGHDWFHNNSLAYDADNNSLVLSGRNQDAIISLDYETGALNWIIGDSNVWPEDMQHYFFQPKAEEGKPFEWSYGQHSAIVIPGGDIMALDNGCWRNKDDAENYPGGVRYSRGVRYRIHPEDKTIEQVWQFGKELGEPYFAPNVSNVAYYDENHYMVHFGSNGFLYGKVCEKTPMAYSGKDAKHLISDSITMEIMDGEVIYEMHLPASYYRAQKWPVYDQVNFQFGKGKLLGALAETKTERMKIKAEQTGEMIPDLYDVSIVEELDRLCLNATFETGTLVQVLLTNGEEVRRYNYKTTPQRVLSMCVGTFKKDDVRNVDLYINKQGLHGTYQVQMIVEDKLYETGVTLTVE